MLINQVIGYSHLFIILSNGLANNNVFNSLYIITISFLLSILMFTCLALCYNKINNSKYLDNKTIYTILFSVSLLLILLVYGLTIFSYVYKTYKLMQGLFMENNSNSEKKMSNSKKNSPKQKTANFSGGGDSDDSDKTSSSKKRKRENDEEIITKPLKKIKIENLDSPSNETEKQLVKENKDMATDDYISNNSSDSSRSEEAERTISYAEKGKARFVPEDPQVEVSFNVPSEYDDPTAWLSEEELFLAKLDAKEFVESSDYETYLEVDDNNHGHFLKATNAFQDLIEGIKYERDIPLSVRDCIHALARETVFWSEVVDCFVEKFQDMPD